MRASRPVWVCVFVCVGGVGGCSVLCPMARGQIQICQAAQYPVCSHESPNRPSQHPIYRQTLCPNSIHIPQVGCVEQSAHMCLFFTLKKTELRGANFTPCHCDLELKRPKCVRMCIQSGAVSGGGGSQCVFGSRSEHSSAHSYIIRSVCQ